MLEIVRSTEILYFLDESLDSIKQICLYFLNILGKTESKLLESAEERRLYVLKLLLFEDIYAVEFGVVEILHCIHASFLSSDSEIFVVVADSDAEALVEEIIETCFYSLAELTEDEDGFTLHVSADFS